MKQFSKLFKLKNALSEQTTPPQYTNSKFERKKSRSDLSKAGAYISFEDGKGTYQLSGHLQRRWTGLFSLSLLWPEMQSSLSSEM